MFFSCGGNTLHLAVFSLNTLQCLVWHNSEQNSRSELLVCAGKTLLFGKGGFRSLMTTSISSLVTFRHKGKLIYLAKASIRMSDLYDFTVFKVLQVNYNSWFKQT